MQKNRFPTRAVVFCGVAAALSIVFGKLLQIPIGDSVRISLENLPILFVSFCFGPVWGALTGAAADLVGCLVMGYTVIPLVTLGAILVGVLPALFRRPMHSRGFSSVLVPVLLTHLVASLIVKSAGLYFAYYFGSAAFLPVLGFRVLTYAALTVPESGILYVLLRTPAIRAMMRGEGRA